MIEHDTQSRQRQQGWHIDKSVSISQVLTVAIVLVSCLTFFSGMDKRIDINTQAIEQNKTNIDKQEDRVTKSLDSINSKLDQLSNMLIKGR
ncbi:MAG: hypothetical protein ACPGMR_03300 [Pontibacterium sp.]